MRLLLTGAGGARLDWINRRLARAGWMLMRRPPSAKMLREHANISESFHPSRGGRTVRWMRAVADAMGEDR